MNLVMEKTFEQYEKLFSMEEQKREDEFRCTMMRPFEKMWTHPSSAESEGAKRL